MIRVLRTPLLQTPNQQLPLVQLLKNQRFLIFTFSTQLTHFIPQLCQYLWSCACHYDILNKLFLLKAAVVSNGDLVHKEVFNLFLSSKVKATFDQKPRQHFDRKSRQHFESNYAR